MTMTVSNNMTNTINAVEYTLIYSNNYYFPVSAPIVTTTTSSDIAIDAEPFNFTCNVTTPLLGADITWIDSFGKCTCVFSLLVKLYNNITYSFMP